MSIGALNKRPINKDTLNSSVSDFVNATLVDVTTICLGEFNAAPVDSYEMDGCRFFAPLGVQTVLKVAQLVGFVVVPATVILISQEVGLSVTVDESTVIAIAQNVGITLAANTSIELAQIVDGPGTFLNLHGWDVDIVIGNISIPKENIAGSDVIITKESNQNTLCEFSVRVSDPLNFLRYIDGAEIKINYLTSTGYRLFTGIVDLPEIDLINKVIKVRCSDRREELIKAKMLPILPTIGRYSESVQGKITSVGQEMEYRLQTTPADVDFDAYNTPNLNSWYAKAVPDFSLAASDVYYRTPKVTWQSRGSVVNDVTVALKYQYTRLYHYQRSFTWTDSGDPSPALGARFDIAATHATVAMVKAAINQAGWQNNQSLTYTDNYAANTYPCFAYSYGGPCLNLLNEDIGTTQTRNIAPPYNTITTVYAIPPATVDETRVTAAAWVASTRFSQNIEETYTFNVFSTQSIGQFGDLTAFDNYTLTQTYDDAEWVAYHQLTAAPSNAVSYGVNYYANQDSDVNGFNTAVLTAIDRAKTQIIGTHRDTKIDLEIPIKPELELRHTLSVSSAPISCKGKVSKIVHKLNLAERTGNSTTIQISLFKANGSAVTTATSVPARISDAVAFDTGVVAFGSHRRLDTDMSDIPDAWNGYIGVNKTGGTKTPTTKFVVDTPAIPNELRKLKSLAVTHTYETAIVSDDLDIEF